MQSMISLSWRCVLAASYRKWHAHPPCIVERKLRTRSTCTVQLICRIASSLTLTRPFLRNFIAWHLGDLGGRKTYSANFFNHGWKCTRIKEKRGRTKYNTIHALFVFETLIISFEVWYVFSFKSISARLRTATIWKRWFKRTTTRLFLTFFYDERLKFVNFYA